MPSSKSSSSRSSITTEVARSGPVGIRNIFWSSPGHFERARKFERMRDKALDQEVRDAKATGNETEVVRHQVGVANDELQSLHASNPDMHPSPQRPDHLALKLTEKQLEAHEKGEEVHAVAYSDKSYEFGKYINPKANGEAKFSKVETVVNDHVTEAAKAYAGSVEIRRDQFGKNMRGETVIVDKIVLTYDKTVLRDETLQKRVTRNASRAARANGITVEVVFK